MLNVCDWSVFMMDFASARVKLRCSICWYCFPGSPRTPQKAVFVAEPNVTFICCVRPNTLGRPTPPAIRCERSHLVLRAGRDAISGDGSSGPLARLQRLGLQPHLFIGALDAWGPPLPARGEGGRTRVRLRVYLRQHAAGELVGGPFEFSKPAPQRLGDFWK